MSRELVADLAGVSVGDGRPVAIMGVINVSPESFHRGSIRSDTDLLPAALAMVDAGASLIDVGARSTAPYLATEITPAAEAERLARAIERLAAKLPVPISADTCRSLPARAALEAGARVINDVSALCDSDVAQLVVSHSASLVLMSAAQVGERRGRREAGGRPSDHFPSRAVGRQKFATSSGAKRQRTEGTGHPGPPPAPRPPRGSPAPVASVRKILSDGLRRARAAGIPQRRIVVDPGIGFFRDTGMPWDEWDARVLVSLASLRSLGRPICVGVSRKSFIGEILHQPDTSDRLAGSLAATAIAVVNGAAIIRTHDVAETRDAVRVAERLRAMNVARSARKMSPAHRRGER
ncbi:MAG TPA: dihydropteroate synthase [Methylomirabilota bacterium]|nr:dihydropteroate synthase [Methylomirabilota bacterium]